MKSNWQVNFSLGIYKVYWKFHHIAAQQKHVNFLYSISYTCSWWVFFPFFIGDFRPIAICRLCAYIQNYLKVLKIMMNPIKKFRLYRSCMHQLNSIQFNSCIVIALIILCCRTNSKMHNRKPYNQRQVAMEKDQGIIILNQWRISAGVV